MIRFSPKVRMVIATEFGGQSTLASASVPSGTIGSLGKSDGAPKQSPAPNSENAIQLAYILAAERGQDAFTLDRWLDNTWKGRRNGSQEGKSM